MVNNPTARVDVFLLRSGQPRPYADSVYEADLVFSNWWQSLSGPKKGKWCPDEAHVKGIAKLLVRHFDDKPEYGLCPYLKSIEKIKPDTWKVIIVEPYCD